MSLDIASAPSLCFYTEFSVSAYHCSYLARKLAILQRLCPMLELWCGGCGRLGESRGAMADSHPNAPGVCPTSSDAVGPTNEHYNLYILKGLGDSEAAQ